MARLVNGSSRRVGVILGLGLCVLAASGERVWAESSDITARLDKYEGPATLQVQRRGRYEVRIDLDPKTEHKPLAIRVQLPNTGRNVWPAADVEVIDPQGRAMSVRRNGIEWHNLLIPVRAARCAYLVHVVDPPGGRPRWPSEKERHVADPATGFSAAIARWHDSRRAALSIRFDDSHPTHLSKAVPLLREYGFRGTFMVNPGGHDPNSRRRSAFQDHRAEWEACAGRGDQEFANHTMHHRGAANEAEMEYEIGEAAKAIWSLFPTRSRILALNLGGGTQWETATTLRYYLDKYHLFDASSGSLGMDDVYGNRVLEFRRQLQRHIDAGGWCRIHYHAIGKGLNSSQANFRAALEIIKERRSDLWVGGMADIHKYQAERKGSELAVVASAPRRLAVALSCLSDPELYDQPLTIEVTLPKSWPADRVVVRNAQHEAIAAQTTQAAGQAALRFDVPPCDAVFTIERVP